MKINLKNVKVVIVGIQGSGKTELAKHLSSNFKNPYWYLMHKDDLLRMPKKVNLIQADRMSIEELDEICESIIKLGKNKKADCLIIDEADMFLSHYLTSENAKHINDLVINHRHYGLAVIFLTRRPQDIPTKIYESSEHIFLYAMPNSDNVERKLASLDREIPILALQLHKDKHNFIHKRLGEIPTLMKPIKL